MTVGLAGISGVATNRGGFGPEEAQVFEDSVEDVLDLGQGSSVTVVSPITSSLSPPSRRHLEETEGGETDVVFEIYAPETLEVLGYTLEAVVDSGALTEEIQTRGSDTALADAVVDDVSVGYSHAPTISSTEKDSKKKKSSSKATSALLWVALAVGILILLCFGTSAFCWRRRRRRDDEIVPKQCIMSPSSIESDYKDDQEDDEIDLDNIELEDVSSPACKTRRSLDESFLKSPAVVYHSSDDEKVASAPKIVLLRSTSSASPDDNLENRDDLHASSAEQLPVVTLDVVDDDATSPDLETKAIPTDTALSLLPEDEYQSAPANLSLVVEDQREAVLDVNYGPTSQEIDPVPNSQTQASPHATQNFERPPSPRCLKLNIGDDMKTTEDEIQSGASAEGTKKHREVAF